MEREPAPADHAPRWALPLLAAYRVAQRRPHYLRRLPDQEFTVLAKACDRFVLRATLPLLGLSLVLLPSPYGAAAVAVASSWGLLVLALVGAPIAAERHRRRRRAGCP